VSKTDPQICPHLSLHGDEGPISRLGRMPVRWRCDECDAVFSEPQILQIHQALGEHERRAWDSLARCKFWMFGYHAALWVSLNRFSAQPRRNPFASLVSFARFHISESAAVRAGVQEATCPK